MAILLCSRVLNASHGRYIEWLEHETLAYNRFAMIILDIFVFLSLEPFHKRRDPLKISEGKSAF